MNKISWKIVNMKIQKINVLMIIKTLRNLPFFNFILSACKFVKYGDYFLISKQL